MEEEEDGEEECTVLEASDRAQTRRPAASSSGAALDDDDEVQFEGRTGDLALSDFPHGRENCLVHPWTPGHEQDACPNCFCYVCDDNASKCSEWSSHCKATHTSAHWRAQRQVYKIHRGKPPPAATGGGASSSSSAAANTALGFLPAQSSAQSSPAIPRRRLAEDERARWSADQFLKALEQVYPVEAPEPRGFASGIQLRPYQRQSLAFMLALEASREFSLSGMRHGAGMRADHRRVRGGWLADEMGMGKTAVCAALVLAAKARASPPNGLTVVLVNNTLVGQWLDELAKFAPTLHVARYYGTKQLVSYATDVVVTTPNTRPSDMILASVPTHARTRRARHPAPLPALPAQLHLAYPSRPEWLPAPLLLPLRPMSRCRIRVRPQSRARRLIVDESHLYEPKAEPKQPVQKIHKLYTHLDYVWCVTGTPMSNSLQQLETQARMIGQWDSGLVLSSLLCASPASYHPPHPSYDSHKARSNEQIVDALQRLMIRHTKAQRLAGEAALSLPEAAVDTVWLTMSAEERILYALHGCADGVPRWADSHRATALTLKDLDQGLSKRRYALASQYQERAVTGSTAERPATLADLAPGKLRPEGARHFQHLQASPVAGNYNLQPVGVGDRAHRCTKYKAVLADLATLWQAQPAASVVLFTHYNTALGELCAMLAMHMPQVTVFKVSRTSTPASRHAALRRFQAGGQGGAMVFATTFATAAVGLTLTQASRVYLLEASLDPATEAQAAGRIHRLGQEKEGRQPTSKPSTKPGPRYGE